MAFAFNSQPILQHLINIARQTIYIHLDTLIILGDFHLFFRSFFNGYRPLNDALGRWRCHKLPLHNRR